MGVARRIRAPLISRTPSTSSGLSAMMDYCVARLTLTELHLSVRMTSQLAPGSRVELCPRSRILRPAQHTSRSRLPRRLSTWCEPEVDTSSYQRKQSSFLSIPGASPQKAPCTHRTFAKDKRAWPLQTLSSCVLDAQDSFECICFAEVAQKFRSPM